MINYTARSKTGTYHQASYGSAHCNQRMHISGPVGSETVAKASPSMFCEKCFPRGKPGVA